MTSLIGGIEAGGTKFVCVVASEHAPDHIIDSERIPTTTPAETIARCVAFFERHRAALTAIGVATFGPAGVRPDATDYGYITTTPKPGWGNTNILGPLSKAFGLPMGFDTDVNGAALGEHRYGAGRGLTDFVYFTIGTGIGGGALVNGRLLHGLVHPEMGHIAMPRDPDEDPFTGVCPFHGDCFEGLASGPALEKRWGAKAETFGPDHPAWEREAEHIACALQSVICLLSPQRVILGGGVMSNSFLFPMIRRKTLARLRGYVQSPAILNEMDGYIVPPGLGDRAGAVGAIALGQLAREGVR
jgi:fructokinase